MNWLTESGKKRKTQWKIMSKSSGDVFPKKKRGHFFYLTIHRDVGYLTKEN